MGLVYILSHKAMPNLLKIGYTDRALKERMRELESTGVPGAFTAELYFYTDKPKVYESTLHRTFNLYRHKKEFFKIQIGDVIAVIDAINDEKTEEKIELFGASKNLILSKSYKASMNVKILREAKEIEERNQKLANMSFENLEKLYWESYTSFDRKIIEPFYKDAKRKKLIAKKAIFEESKKTFDEQKVEFFKLTNLLNNLISENKPFKYTFGLLVYDEKDGFAIGRKVRAENLKYIESFIVVYRVLFRLDSLPDLREVDGYLDGKTQDFLFVEGNLKERKPIFNGFMNYYFDAEKEFIKLQAPKKTIELTITKKKENRQYTQPPPPKVVENLGDFKSGKMIDDYVESDKSNYHLSKLHWRRTQEGIHCEYIGEFYSNEDFGIDGGDVVVIYKSKKCHIPKVNIIDFYFYETLNLKFD